MVIFDPVGAFQEQFFPEQEPLNLDPLGFISAWEEQFGTKERIEEASKPSYDPLGALKEKISTFTAPYQMFSDPLAGLQEVVGDPFGAISEAIGDPFGALQEQWSATQKGVGDWGAGVQDYFANLQKGVGDWFGGIGDMFGGLGAGIGGFFGGIVNWLGKYWWVIAIVIVAGILLYFSPTLLPLIKGAGKGMKIAGIAGKLLGGL